MLRPMPGLLAVVLLGAGSAPAVAQQGPPTLYIGPIDYPAGVAPIDRERRVGVRYIINTDGRITDCTVVRSSGEQLLDDESCRIVRERARFRAQRDGTSARMNFVWRSETSTEFPIVRGAPLPLVSIVWLIRDNDYPEEARRRNEEGTVTIAVTVGMNGMSQGCTIVGSSGSPSLDRRTCEIVNARAMFLPASDGAGGRRVGIFCGRLTWSLGTAVRRHAPGSAHLIGRHCTG